MEHRVNASIQVVPIQEANGLPFIDQSIAIIQNSGLIYEVGPFSTSVEGSFKEITQLVQQIRSEIHQSGLEEVLINLQIHSHSKKSIQAADKTRAHRRA